MNSEQIEARLLGAFYDTAGAFPIHDGCERMMRDLIHLGVQQMTARNEAAHGAVEKAVDSVRAFTLEMKDEARAVGRDSIGEFTFGPVMGRLHGGQRQGWWPFTLTV